MKYIAGHIVKNRILLSLLYFQYIIYGIMRENPLVRVKSGIHYFFFFLVIIISLVNIFFV